MTGSDERDRTEAAIRSLSVPAEPDWLSGRVLTLLNHYFVADQKTQLSRAVAEDWLRALDRFPAWAVENACRWWISAENKTRRYKPVPGDIEARAEAEMSRVRVARMMVDRFEAGGIAPLPPREIEAPASMMMSDDERARCRAVGEAYLERATKRMDAS